MAQNYNLRTALLCCGVGSLIVAGGRLQAEDSVDSRQQLQLLQEQNRALQEELRQQRALINSLTQKVTAIQAAAEERGRNPKPEPELDAPTPKPSGFSLGAVRISGEGGVAFFDSGSAGMFPNNEFRIDEARLFVEAPITDNVYFFSELNLATREDSDLQLNVGELYLDFENVSRAWGQERMLNVRAGRFYIPFGEEYQHRYAIDNLLISHSLADLWGVDEGVELYGCLGKFSYTLAVQNGGIPDATDYNGDKSVTARLGFDPVSRLHLSVSAMRTGNLNVNDDQLSAMWFGNGFFRSLGSTNTTNFRTDLLEADVEWRLPHGRLHAFGGYAHYEDNDPSANNRRDVYYYSVEGVNDITRKLYAGFRFSQIFANKGFPIVGNGEFGEYFYNTLTDQIWRLSLGVGYRWSPNLIFKTEYSLEGGETTSGDSRDHENLFALEAAFKF